MPGLCTLYLYIRHVVYVSLLAHYVSRTLSMLFFRAVSSAASAVASDDTRPSSVDILPVVWAGMSAGGSSASATAGIVGAGSSAGGGVAVDVAAAFCAGAKGGTSTLFLTCFSLTIAMSAGPKSLAPSNFANLFVRYSTSRSRLMVSLVEAQTTGEYQHLPVLTHLPHHPRLLHAPGPFTSVLPEYRCHDHRQLYLADMPTEHFMQGTRLFR
jgi:hypothetical protein